MILPFVLFLTFWCTTFQSEEPPAENKGILFHTESKILLTEKFYKAEFLVPYPKYNFTLHTQMERMLTVLKNAWSTPTYMCADQITVPYNNATDNFNVDWLYKKIQDEARDAESQVQQLRDDTAQLLPPSPTYQEHERKRRVAPAVIAAAVAGIGFFGATGIAMSNNQCGGITGIFGSCQETMKNTENIDRLASSVSKLNEYVLEVADQTDRKFFLVAKELAEIHEIQEEMYRTQNENWKKVTEQFAVVQQNFNILQSCMQLQFSSQQLNFNFDTAASVLLTLYADIKSYRAALYAFRLNVINSIPTLLDKRLPMSLVPKKSLIKVLNAVHDSQKYSSERLTLAIPMTDLLSYYDAKLVSEVSSIPEGLLMTLSIPLASGTTVFSVLKAHVIPMPQQDSDEALQWTIEGDYLAVAEEGDDTAVLTQAQFDTCLGSPRYRICHETLEIQKGYKSCLATLYKKSSMDALQICDTELVKLPYPPKAKNLGYGIWLVLSSSDKFVFDAKTPAGHHSKARNGCKVCLLTLDCGTELSTDNLRIKADLKSCQRTPAKRVEVQLVDPLAHLLAEVPPLDLLPKYDRISDANLDLIRQVKTEFTLAPRPLTTSADLEEIAKPIARKMANFKPILLNKLESYVPLKLSLTLTATVFIGNVILHFLCSYLYYKCAFIRKLIPNFLKIRGRSVPLDPVVSVPKQYKKEVIAKLKASKKTAHVISPEDLQLPNMRKHASLPGLNTPGSSRPRISTLHTSDEEEEEDMQRTPTRHLESNL